MAQLPDCDSSDASGNTNRFLSVGDVVHINNAGTLPRNEVVSAVQDALSGESNFDAQSQTDQGGIVLVDLTRNGMVLTPAAADLENEGFTVTNYFIVDEPDVLYEVTCPPASDSDVCNAARTSPAFFGTQACLLKEDGISNIPKYCLDQEYDLKFYVAVAPHFMLGASTSIDGCPNIAFASSDGGKHKIKFKTQDISDIPSYYFGKVALDDILRAEEDTPPTENENKNFNLETNTCVHYGREIWRTLGFTESDELAQFVISGVLNAPNFEDMAKRHVGGIRYLAAKAVGADSALKKHLEGVVYSQCQGCTRGE